MRHVIPAIELKAVETAGLAADVDGVLPARLLAGFGWWCAIFVLEELSVSAKNGKVLDSETIAAMAKNARDERDRRTKARRKRG